MEEVNNTKIVKTLAAEYLFMVIPNKTNLDAEKSDVFHTIISKVLFLCKRARTNIQLKVPFLFTRFKIPDEDDWKIY